MKLKICLIIICLLIFGCKSKEEPIYIERIGRLMPGNGMTTCLYVFVNKEYGEYDFYNLHFRKTNGTWWSGWDDDTLPWGEIVKVIGRDTSYWQTIPTPPYTEKRYQLEIAVESIEVIYDYKIIYPDNTPPESIEE